MPHISPERINPELDQMSQVTRLINELIKEETISYDIGRVLFGERVVMAKIKENYWRG